MMYSQFHNVSLVLKWVSRTILMLLVLTTPLCAESVQIDALVNTINGSAQSVFQVLRGEKRLDVTLMMVLQAGDWLCVRQPKNEVLKDEQNYIMVTFGGNQSEKVTFANSPYLVKKRGTTASIPKNVIADTKKSWAEMFTHFLEEVQALTREDEKGDEPIALSMPLLTKYGEQQLTSGERVLHLAWQGGNAPYWVQVYTLNAKKALLTTQINSKRMQFEKQLLNAGNYRVVVHDAKGQNVEGKIKVVDNLPTTLKQVEQALKISSISERDQQTLFAAWLAQRTTWRFEAYQRIVGKKYQPALLLKNLMEK